MKIRILNLFLFALHLPMKKYFNFLDKKYTESEYNYNFPEFAWMSH